MDVGENLVLGDSELSSIELCGCEKPRNLDQCSFDQYNEINQGSRLIHCVSRSENLGQISVITPFDDCLISFRSSNLGVSQTKVFFLADRSDRTE